MFAEFFQVILRKKLLIVVIVKILTAFTWKTQTQLLILALLARLL